MKLETLTYEYTQGHKDYPPGLEKGVDSVVMTSKGEVFMEASTRHAKGRFLEIQTGGDVRARNKDTPMLNRDGSNVALIDSETYASDVKAIEVVAQKLITTMKADEVDLEEEVRQAKLKISEPKLSLLREFIMNEEELSDELVEIL